MTGEEKVEGFLLQDRVRVWEGFENIHNELYYGKKFDDHVDLSLSEAMHLVERDELVVKDDDKEYGRKELFSKFCSYDDEFQQKFVVYSDLRERGYILKSGFKFGAHFRVYPRGVNPYKDGPKDQKEHTKWVVHSVPEDHNLSFAEMSRAVRLAQNIRATMLWGVVDSEKGVTYYKVERITP